jgi:hypothetical protein
VGTGLSPQTDSGRLVGGIRFPTWHGVTRRRADLDSPVWLLWLLLMLYVSAFNSSRLDRVGQ